MSIEFRLPEAAGNDPYDALRSPVLPRAFRKQPRLRQLAIQLRRRCPVDLGSALHIAPFVMAKTVGCLLSAEARVAAATGNPDRSRHAALIEALDATGSESTEGAWGYEFDVQTRWSFYGVGEPNLIATSFVGRGLLTSGLVYRDTGVLDRGVACARFANRELLRLPGDGQRPVYRYTRDTERLIHNANLLGCALAFDASAASGERELAATATAAAMVTVRAQDTDGSWPYGDAGSLGWVDSFHTAYNLDGLLQAWLFTGDAAIEESLAKGAAFWASNFFEADGAPRYYPRRAYPYDIHSAATAVDVGSRLATWGVLAAELPNRVARWTERHLVDSSTGRTYYQRHRLWTDRRHFVRWGDAHWALARSSRLLLEAGMADPLERAVRGGRDE